MATIISTAVKLLLDSNGFKSGLADAVSSAQNTANQLENVGDNASSGFEGVARSLALISNNFDQLDSFSPVFGNIAQLASMASIALYGAAAAQTAWTYAVEGTTVAIGALEAVGLPLFAAIGVLIAAAAAAAALLAWSFGAFDSSAESVKKMDQELLGSIRSLREWEAAMAKAQDTFGMSEGEKRLYEYNQLLKQRKDLTDEERASLLAAAEADVKRLEALKEQARVKEEMAKRQAMVDSTLYDLQKKLDQMDMSPLEKQLNDLADKGLNAEELEQARALIEEMERRKNLAEETAKAEKEAEQSAKEAARVREQAARQEEAARRAAAQEAARAAAEAARDAERDVRDAERKVQALENAGASGSGTTAPKFINAGSAQADLEKTRTAPFDRLTQIQQMQLEEARRQLEELRRIEEAARAAAEEAKKNAQSQANF